LNWFEHADLAPADHLAWEEAALDAVEAGESPPLLWFWESSGPFVVLGYGQRAAAEADLDACGRDGVPVLRRCSGGGAVVQGPGCLNYGVAVPIEPDGPTASITGTNDWVMERQRRAIEAAAGRPVARRGDTDLAVGDRKFSGNAQRRKRRALLFHGTLLLAFDLDTLARWLRFPSLQPDYRAGRGHGEFVANLGIAAAQAKTALVREWGAQPSAPPEMTPRVRELRAARYGDPAWHARR
jgi:lipoate-protein ligase A